MTIYAIMAPAVLTDQAYSVFQFTNWAFTYLGLTASVGISTPQLAGSGPTPRIAAIGNKSIVTVCGGSSSSLFYVNYATGTNTAPGSIALFGGEIGGASVNKNYSGLLYGLLIYAQAHTASQITQNIAAIATTFSVQTSYTKMAVCRGDSITAGAHSSNLQAWPFQLMQQYPEIKLINLGLSSSRIGSNSISGTLYALDTTWADNLYDSSMQINWLLFKAGINDINSDGLTAAQTYSRLTNYFAARLAAHPAWTLVCATLAADASNATVDPYNQLIRTNANPYFSLVSDSGKSSPSETRLNNSSDTTYFYTDQLHLVNAGYEVVKEHFAQFINVPHRTTGFFAP